MEPKVIVLCVMWVAWAYSCKHLGFFSLFIGAFLGLITMQILGVK